MSLRKKVQDLMVHAALAQQVAATWQKAIDLHGEDKATAFYTHLGLNHLHQSKSVEWEGLQLSRQPTPHEALQVKAIAAAQDSAKERLTNLLLVIRNVLVDDALAKLAKLSAANYHKLIVTVAFNDWEQLFDAVAVTFNDGRLLIAAQRGIKADDDDFDDELDTLTSIATSRLANDVQARITGAASRFALLGQSGATLIASVTGDVRSASTAYVDRIATGLANRTISFGRSVEAAKFDWQRVEYSSLLDSSVCGPCLDADGESSTSEDDLTPAPNPECEGYDNCRCFHVFVQD